MSKKNKRERNRIWHATQPQEKLANLAEIIPQLEEMSDMTADDKASILLVAVGLKPSAFVIIEGVAFRPSDKPKHANPKIVECLHEILAKLDLAFTETTEIMRDNVGKAHERHQEVKRFFVAPKPETALQLRNLFGDIRNNHVPFGYLLGYPRTAVDAFLTPNMIDPSELPSSTKDVSEENMRFLNHRLSKDNWREEVRYIEDHGNYIKSVSPVIYNKIISRD